MKLNDIRDLTKDDVLATLGLKSKPRAVQRLGGALGLLGVGLLVGAAVALLLAPKSGRELRSDLEDRLRDARRRADDTVRDAPKNVRNTGAEATT